MIVEAVFQCLMAQTGLGKHAWMLTEKMTLRFYQVQFSPCSYLPEGQQLTNMSMTN